MLDTLRKSYHLAGHTPRSRWVVLLVLAIIVSVVEAIGAVMIFSLLSLVASPDTRASSPVSKVLHDIAPSLDERGLLVASIIVIAAFFISRAGILTAQSYLQNRIMQNAGVVLSTRLLRGYLALPYSLHLQRNSSELVRNVFSSVADVTGYAWIPGLGLVSDGLTVLAMAVVLLVTAPLPTLMTIVVLGPTVLALVKVVQPRLRRLGVISQDTAGATFQSLHQSFEGLRDIKLLGRERYFETVFSRGRASYARAQYGRAVLVDIPRVALETTLMLFILGFLLVTAVPDEGANTDALAVLGLFGYAVIRLLPSINRTVANVNSIRFGAAAVNDLHADIELIDSLEGTDHAPVDPLPFEHDIVFDDVSFSYPGTDGAALEHDSLRIERGESIGVVGSTGAGKSTMLDLLVGLLHPTTGRVLVDGHDVRESSRAWHLRLGVVPQTLFLVDDTLRRNIALGAEDVEIDEARLQAAVATAQLRDFVETLPEELETVVGERGVRLSGGQRQRIAIARALYRDPSVLVFDEGTSALDMLTEKNLVAALANVARNRTMIVVAHRLATVRACDRIIVLEHGRVVDDGTYDDLLARSSTFRELASGARDGAT
jgi:ATP-binding cassette subfamily C protein